MSEPKVIPDPGPDRPERPDPRRPVATADRGEGGRPVFLRSPAAAPARVGLLARWMGLDLYSSALVTRKVRTELSILAAVLLVVFLFELAAWSFFWNGLVVGRMHEFSPVGSSIAAFLGLLFAGTILFFERQVITVDVERQEKGKRLWVQLIRVIVILGAGYIVAHPVDLLAFRVPVENLLHVEAVEEEVERLSQDVDGMVAAGSQDRRLADLDRGLADLERRKEVRTDQLIAAQGEMKGHEREVELLRSDVYRARQALNRARQHRDLAELEDPVAAGLLEQRVGTAFERYRAVAAELHRAEAGLEDARARVAALRRDDGAISTRAAERVEARERAAARQDLLRQAERRLRERLRRWRETLLLAGPRDQTESPELLARVPEEIRELWPDEWQAPLTYEAPEPDFFQRIDAVYRLAFAWTGSGEGLEEVRRTAPEGRFASSKAYFSVYLGIHLAAIFIPFLVFIVKWFLISREVDDYFSARHQAEAGNADARTVLSAEERVREGGA